MRWLSPSLGVLYCLAWLVTPADAFISRIRDQAGQKLPCHQASTEFRWYVLGYFTPQVILDHLQIHCNCTMDVGTPDHTDLENFRAVLDGIGIIEIGSTPQLNNTELVIQALRKLAKIDDFEKGCGSFELGNDALMTEQQLRTGLGIP